MAHRGRSSASQAIILATTMLILLLLQTSSSQAAFTVGDNSGWTYNIQSWTNGKKFKAGDTLNFNYDPSLHNVVVVDGNGYKSCTASPSSKAYSSGKDEIILSRGRNYFICSIPDHCGAGLKLAVVAS